MVSFGLSLGVSSREPLLRAPEIAREAEKAGFKRLYFIDFQLAMKDVYVTLALCAVNTERIQLGTGVTNPITRDPTVTACAISAIQEVSKGRAILGIGVVADIRGYQAVGVSHFVFDLPGPDPKAMAETMERFAEEVRPKVARARR